MTDAITGFDHKGAPNANIKEFQMSYSYFGLTSAVATVSELQVQRRQEWGRAGTPDWGRW